MSGISICALMAVERSREITKRISLASVGKLGEMPTYVPPPGPLAMLYLLRQKLGHAGQGA
jgi:hypothetical protein